MSRAEPAVEPFFTTLAPGRFFASAHCAGPWDPALQHAGPPEALIAREMRALAGRDDMLLSRFTFELLGPIPLGEVEVDVQVVRPGSRVQMLEATLSASERPVVRARAWQIARSDAAPSGGEPAPAALPASASPGIAPWDQSGYISSMEWRFTQGHYAEPGPAAAWARPSRPLVDADPLTGWDRLFLLADSANGISAVLDIAAWYSIPPETSLHLIREPVGEWVFMDAATVIADGGPGVARGTLSDEHGLVGLVTQSLLVAHR